MLAATLRCARRCTFLMETAPMATVGTPGPPSIPRHTNRLINEKSPYLLQHAHNPVDWYPWGQEAFDKAKTENKLIFLSVGYSTCHWCHVMEEESFKSKEIGEIMNEHFVCIKVDREERPDVDKVYMTFVQWKENKDALLESSQRILEALQHTSEIRVQGQESPPPAKEVMDTCFQQLSRSYDEDYGGFSKSPKFPTPVNLNFLFTYWALHRTTPEGARALQMALHTLKMMAHGGIHDHIGQGFHRYSTDQHWHVPHFEKMLYDQGQLAVMYSKAFQISGDEFFADVVRDILLYVSRDLSDQEGGFYSAEDADSYPTTTSKEKQEGAFCVWAAEELRALLPDPVKGATEGTTLGDVFMHHYGVEESGNVDPMKDPHQELKGKNVLIARCSPELTAARFGLEPVQLSALLQECRQRLSSARAQRPRPHLDTKMLAAWNGLMISGFAQAGAALSEKGYVSRAAQAAAFLRTHLFDPNSGRLLRSCYRGKDNSVEQSAVPIQGFLEDYVFVIQALFDLYEASLEQGWLEWALHLQHMQDKLFWDAKGFAYFSTEAGDPSLLLRLKDDQDGAEPTPNSISVTNLLRAACYSGHMDWVEKARKILAAFSERLQKIPITLPEMVRATAVFHHTLKQVLMVADGDSTGFLYRQLPFLASLERKDGKATAYICSNFTCSLPVTSVQELRGMLSP
ncbi:spermatogenesis-associated protein 20 isoform X8 [Hirundo rustica]|uniref:spermatogenesis-associated protein 20 isoform X8 n=1 Tax=Hirundo rustica TaxID=43150 RepID=UPI001A9485B0|nr:spermatogenesis-associated protein 20 isoform X8 [Hirundo rustica]